MLERVVVHGDLSKLAPGDRAVYYGQVCSSLGLNPLTRPFEYLTLNGKQILYARRDCTDQLRKIHNVSVTIVAREHIGELLVVTARATLPSNRADESTGAVAVGNLKGEALANAMMKAETKAKRRVTLSICGLAVLDESEVEGAQATDREHHHSPHTAPGESLDEVPRDSPEYEAIMAELARVEKEMADTRTATWDHVCAWRGTIGDKSKLSALGQRISTLYQSDELAPIQKADMSKFAQRVNRSLKRLEGIVPKPSVEALFEDKPEREPGQDDEGEI
jgi:hypothetical protein